MRAAQEQEFLAFAEAAMPRLRRLALGTVRFFERGRIETTINGARYEIELYRSPDGRSLRTFFPRFLGMAGVAWFQRCLEALPPCKIMREVSEGRP